MELLASENSFQKGSNKQQIPYISPTNLFIIHIFSCDWFDCFCKQRRSNSEEERQKKQLWKIPTSHSVPSTLKIFSVSTETSSTRLSTSPEKGRFNHDRWEFRFMGQCLSMLSQIQHPIFQINHPQIFTFIGAEGNSFEDPVPEFNGISL